MNKWINDRFPLAKFLHWSLHEEIPGGARFSYTLGSAALFLFVLQIITGLWQLFYYVPTIDHAYESLTYLRREIPFGWLIHGLHYWGATAFTVVVGLHVLRVFIWGAYKKPREMVWLVGVFLLFLTAVFMLTGPILPWDKHGYWAAKVGLSIASSAPFLGPWIQNFLQGTAQIGQATLSRIYLIHVAFLPGLMAFLVMIHLIAFRQFGSTGPWKEEKRKIKGYFWPEQVFKDVLVAFCILILLIALSAFVPAPYSGAADPGDTTYAPKPEWNFLFIYQSLKPFKGEWERLGTLGIPLTILLLMLSLPFLDRSPERNPFKRFFVMGCGAGLVLFILYMTYTGFRMNANGVVQDQNSLSERANPIESQALLPLNHEGYLPWKSEVQHRESLASGRYLFYQYCIECHTISGRPNGLQGPDLVRSLKPTYTWDWLKVQLMSPHDHFPHTTMPSFNYLKPKEIAALIDFLQGLSSREIPPDQEGSHSPGETLFKTIGCAGCHTVDGHSADTQGPDLVQALSVRRPNRGWLKTQIKSPDDHFSNTTMPAYGYLHDDQISALIDYLQTLVVTPYPPRESVKIPVRSVELKENESNGSRKSEASHLVGESEHGEILYKQYCMVCHNPQEKNHSSIIPIRKDLYSNRADDFVLAIDPWIQHGHAGSPAFGDKAVINQSQIADIEAYILHANDVERSQIDNPGISPQKFFWLVIGSSLAIGFCLFLLIFFSR